MFLRVLRALRGMISFSMLLNDPGMLYWDEPYFHINNLQRFRSDAGTPKE